MTGGAHEGRPYGGLAARLNVTGDHEGRPCGGGGSGWIIAPVLTRSGSARK